MINGKCSPINEKGCLLIAQSLRFLRLMCVLKALRISQHTAALFISLFPMKAPIKEQESSALPTELTTHFVKEKGFSNKKPDLLGLGL